MQVLVGLRIGAIEGVYSKQAMLHISTLLSVYNKPYSEEVHPGVTPFSRVSDSEGFQ